MPRIAHPPPISPECMAGQPCDSITTHDVHHVVGFLFGDIMPLVDLKRTKKERKDEDKGMPTAIDSDPYPWGLELTLEKDQLAKLPELKGMDAGEDMTMVAKVRIKRVESVDADSPDGNRESVTLQVRKIGFPDEKSLNDVFSEEAAKG